MTNLLSGPAKARSFLTALLFTLLASAAILVGCRSSPADYMARGRKYVEQKQYDRAVLEFKNAARLQPKSAEPYYQSALAYLALGNPQAAAVSLLNASRIDPNHPGVRLKLAEMKSVNRDQAVVREGESAAQSLLQAQPGNSDAANALAMAEFRLGDSDAAIAHFRQALAASPANISSAINLAAVQLSKNDAAGAESTLQHAKTGNPRSPELDLALGRLYLVTNRPGDAEHAFQHAIAVQPGFSPALIDLAALYIRNGRLAEADRTYASLAALPDPRFRTVHALFLERQNRLDAAITELAALHAKDPANREIRTLLVDAYLKDNKASEAAAVIDSALHANPADTDALLQRSEIYVHNQRYADAQRDLWQVLHNQPNSAQARYALARVYRSQHELSEGQELSEALRLDPNLLPARIDLARFSILQSRAEAALEILDQTPAAQQNNVEVAIQRNTALLQLGKTAALRASLDRSLATSRAPELLLQDALLRIKLHDFAGARKSVHEALEEKPGDVAAIETLSVAYLAQNQKEQAVTAVQAEVNRHPSVPALVFLGQLLQSNGRHNDARATFLRAQATDPNSEPPALALAELALEDNQGVEAKRILERLTVSNDNDPLVHVRLGMADELTQDFPGAIEQYRRAVDLDAGNVIALNNLASLLLERNHDADAALRWAQKASAAAPDNPTVADTLGWIYFRKGLYGNAVQYLELAAKSNLPVAKYHLGLVCLKTGQTDRGNRLVSAVLRSHPELSESERPADVTR